MKHEVKLINELTESYWRCEKCDSCWSANYYTKTQLENMECYNLIKNPKSVYSPNAFNNKERLVDLLSDVFTSGITMKISEIADKIISDSWIMGPKILPGTVIYRKILDEVYKYTIIFVELYEDGDYVFIDDSDNDYTVYDIGKTIFLTEEEALNSTEKIE